MNMEINAAYECPECGNTESFKKLVWEQRLYPADNIGEPTGLSEPVEQTETVVEISCAGCGYVLIQNEISMHEVYDDRETEDSERTAKALLGQLVENVHRSGLWPVVIGLLKHLLLHDGVKRRDYHYGVFAVADTLCDAYEKQESKANHIPNIDIQTLTRLRKRNMGFL